MSRVGLHFNGTDTYCKVPVSVTSAQSWEVILSISTDLSNRAGNQIYNQPCIFGYDTGGLGSRDFHIDLSNGNLYIFTGLNGSQSSSQIKYGTITGNSDFGWNTGKYIADGAAHIIRAVYENNAISIYLDGEYLGYLNTPSTINSSYLCLGCSQPGEKVYSRYDLYDFTLKVDGMDSVIYAPSDADLALNTLTDLSGNNNNGTLYGTVSSVTYLSASADVFIFDTARIVKDSSAWVYSNPGETSSLINTTTAVELTDLPATQSKTGTAFYQTTTGIKIFNVPSTSEVWIKFDVYFNGSARWRVYDISTNPSSNSTTGITAQTHSAISIFNRSTSKSELRTLEGENAAWRNKLQTIILHMKADATNGLIEFWGDNKIAIPSAKYVGEVNNGVAFSNLYMQSDGAGTFFSNILISNEPLTLDDNVGVNIDVNYFTDIERKIEPNLTLVFDAERIISTGLSVSYFADIERELYYAINYLADIAREIKPEISLAFDAERVVSAGASVDYLVDIQRELYHGYDVDYYADIVRDTYINVDLLFDAERQKISTLTFDVECIISNLAEFLLDTEREIIRIEIFNLDTARYLPYRLIVDGTETTIIPVAQNDAGLQSISIQLAEQQITDQASFVHAGNCNLMEQINGQYLDYLFNLRIEETTNQGALQSCNCCTDVDEILYSQIAYTIPANKYEWSQDYLEAYNLQRLQHPDEDIEPQPSTTIEEHLRSIAHLLGKNFTYRGPKYYSTSSTEEHGGKTYASLISELVGWSSRLPHMEINVFIRASEFFVIQRGYEANTVSLDNAKIANLKINKKIVRTVWGSDVTSESTVDTYPFNWSEFDQEPYTPEGGGTAYNNDDDLIETKTTETDTERNVTTYYYSVDENGGKYLTQEVAVKYEKQSGSWQYVDTITTIHEKVSATQSHISARDSEGSILGETVSPNRFEDRATPYDRGRSNGDFLVMHDGQGNQYKVYGIVHHSETREKGTRTIYGLSLIDTSFPLYGDDVLAYLTQQLIWLNRRTEETITMDVYDLNHVVGFDDKISYNGAIYYLKSNSVVKDEHIVNKQSLTFARWY